MQSTRSAVLPSASLRPVGASRRPWVTASIADAADTSPVDLSSLGEHVDHCNDSRSRWFSVQCAADSVLGFLAPRLVTTVIAVALVFGVVAVIA